MTTRHNDDYCLNETRLVKLETKVEEQTGDIVELSEENKEIKKTHHKDFVSFRNQMNELQGELISINSSIRTLITVVTFLGGVVAILEVLARYPLFR